MEAQLRRQLECRTEELRTRLVAESVEEGMGKSLRAAKKRAGERKGSVKWVTWMSDGEVERMGDSGKMCVLWPGCWGHSVARNISLLI